MFLSENWIKRYRRKSIAIEPDCKNSYSHRQGAHPYLWANRISGNSKQRFTIATTTIMARNNRDNHIIISKNNTLQGSTRLQFQVWSGSWLPGLHSVQTVRAGLHGHTQQPWQWGGSLIWDACITWVSLSVFISGNKKSPEENTSCMSLTRLFHHTYLSTNRGIANRAHILVLRSNMIQGIKLHQ